MECKGIIGNDGRHYILDLLRTFPPDLNFLDVQPEIELSKEAKALGFPIIHKHKLCCLRQELIDAFVESRYMMFIKYAAVQLQQLGLKKQMDMFQKPEQKLEAIKSSPGDKEDNDSGDSNKSKEESDKPKMEEIIGSEIGYASPPPGLRDHLTRTYAYSILHIMYNFWPSISFFSPSFS